MEYADPSETSAATGFRPASIALTAADIPQSETFGAHLEHRGMRIEAWIVLGYIVVTRIGYLPAAKIGIQIGPIPVFLTDLTVMGLLAITFTRRPGWLFDWFIGGAGAGAAGGAVWILFLIAIAYFICAFRQYGLYAVRDFAIFGYSLLFPLTCFGIESRADAARVTRCYTYAGLFLAAIVVLEFYTGVNTGLVHVNKRWLGRNQFAILGTDDVGCIIATSLAAVLSYILLEPRRRSIHFLGALIGLVALFLNTTRSAVLALALAFGQTLLLVRWRKKCELVLLGLSAAAILALALACGVIGSTSFDHFEDSIMAGVRGSDSSSQFRIDRWHYVTHLWLEHPVLGNGFGVPLVVSSLMAPQEAEGRFNAGMPHNTYLFVLARTGIAGLSLIAFCWISSWYGVAAASRSSAYADELALANILASTAGFAGFLLFFERPMNGATFWIMAAVATRLARLARIGPPVQVMSKDRSVVILTDKFRQG